MQAQVLVNKTNKRQQKVCKVHLCRKNTDTLRALEWNKLSETWCMIEAILLWSHITSWYMSARERIASVWYVQYPFQKATGEHNTTLCNTNQCMIVTNDANVMEIHIKREWQSKTRARWLLLSQLIRHCLQTGSHAIKDTKVRNKRPDKNTYDSGLNYCSS